MSDTPAIPRAAVLSGLAGLIPFWATPVIAILNLSSHGIIGLEGVAYTIYGAIILGFLGGVRWGVAMGRSAGAPPEALLVQSVLPSVLGLFAVMLHLFLGAQWGWALIILGLGAQLAWDRAATTGHELPAWYGRLRNLLTFGAVSAGLALMIIYLIAMT